MGTGGQACTSFLEQGAATVSSGPVLGPGFPARGLPHGYSLHPLSSGGVTLTLQLPSWPLPGLGGSGPQGRQCPGQTERSVGGAAWELREEPLFLPPPTPPHPPGNTQAWCRDSLLSGPIHAPLHCPGGYTSAIPATLCAWPALGGQGCRGHPDTAPAIQPWPALGQRGDKLGEGTGGAPAPGVGRDRQRLLEDSRALARGEGGSWAGRGA